MIGSLFRNVFELHRSYDYMIRWIQKKNGGRNWPWGALTNYFIRLQAKLKKNNKILVTLSGTEAEIWTLTYRISCTVLTVKHDIQSAVSIRFWSLLQSTIKCCLFLHGHSSYRTCQDKYQRHLDPTCLFCYRLQISIFQVLLKSYLLVVCWNASLLQIATHPIDVSLNHYHHRRRRRRRRRHHHHHHQEVCLTKSSQLLPKPAASSFSFQYLLIKFSL